MTPIPEPADPVQPLFLSALLRDAVVDVQGKTVGTLGDVIVRLRPDRYPALTGLVMRVGANNVFVPVTDIAAIDNTRISLRNAKLDLRPFERRDGEVLLKEAVLGHRLIDVDRAVLVRAYDVAITSTAEGWLATGLDVHRRGWLPRTHHTQHPVRDWKTFEALIGHEPSTHVRSGFGRLRGLRPAQIADLIETASAKERDDLLGHLHSNPELEADVFEELEDDHQTQVLKARSTQQIAEILSRMRTDDAVDAILDLPQERRRPVVDALPGIKRADVLRLMRYQDGSAGGLMGVEYLAINENETIADVLNVVRHASTMQPEALTTIHSIDNDSRLVGTLSLVKAIQTSPDALLRDVADPEPVHADPRDDIIDIANVMADYNLLSLPILNDTGQIIGVITVDDALEAAIPDDWRRRDRHHHTTTQTSTTQQPRN
ncbi:magnesium transporter MgtE N-terminal domain-containing protein [Subtercola sp. RTI3]|uniref:magnesium transporter MgtE N-terminal domain-containing protein n=1 Tax=Subtercola sp. RTI3 TaxID=3048639 RepID=UPI002B22A335|nr:CBS domain-containing protein [Subtercola sp. RTI3]MEA9984283.1 CBS domain-containing protein [Subtercola sp. RTI3]